MRKLFTKSNIKAFTSGLCEGIGLVTIVSVLPVPPIVKIGCLLAYNIWSADVSLDERMEAFKKTKAYSDTQRDNKVK